MDSKRDLLQEDVTAMIQERLEGLPFRKDASQELAHDIIVVVRERVLKAIESYTRENVR